MKHKKIYSILTLVATSLILMACGDASGSNSTSNPGSISSDSINSINSDVANVTYSTTVKSISGKPLKGISISYKNGNDVLTTGTTNDEGVFSYSVKPGTYTVSLETITGYKLEKTSYTTSLTEFDTFIKATPGIIKEEMPSNKVYSVGDIMYDFTVKDTEGNDWTLSKQFETKDVVIINFWYVGCYWCGSEFPALQSAYSQASDYVSVIGINPGLYPDQGDTDAGINSYKEQKGLTFPCAISSTINNAFNVGAYPTTYVIDRYGIVVAQHSTTDDEASWMSIFDKYVGDSYVPSYNPKDDDGNLEYQKPTSDVKMPASSEIEAAINAEGFTGTYEAETNDDKDTSWPFILSSDGQSIIPSNSGVDYSFATIHLYTTLHKDEVLTFDYFSSCEKGCDTMFVFVDNELVCRISGVENEWKSFNAYIANQTGEHDIAFLYYKDQQNSIGEDVVKIKNVRLTNATDITKYTEVKRDCATNGLNPITGKYNSYAETVLGSDGLYHVGTEEGPLVLASINAATNFSETTLISYATSGELAFTDADGIERDYTALIKEYAQMATNSEQPGLVPVDAELHDALVAITNHLGQKPFDDQWLEVCQYINVYGPGAKEVGNPILGLGRSTAFDVIVDDPTTEEIEKNTVTYDRVIVPRGYYYKFVPTKSGVYQIFGMAEEEGTNCWVLDENNQELMNGDYINYKQNSELNTGYYSENNFSLINYFEAGVTYYVKPAFFFVDVTGSFDFAIQYLSETLNLLTIASPSFYSWEGDLESGKGHVIAGGIDVALVEEGDKKYYHQATLDENGNVVSTGSYVYVEFDGANAMFDYSLKEMLYEGNAFKLSKLDENGQPVLDENGDRIYIADYTEEMKAIYESEVITEGELKGFIKVSERLGEILQAMMDYYDMSGVDHSWTKLCYYYNYLGPKA